MQRKIWIVDDDRSIRWVLGKALESENLNIESFATGTEALSRLSNEQPDVLITDIRMPGINGLELLQQLQSSYPNLPVILMTAHTDLDSAVSAYQGGAFEYLPKPFDLTELLNALNPFAESSEYATLECGVLAADIVNGVMTVEPGATARRELADAVAAGLGIFDFVVSIAALP